MPSVLTAGSFGSVDGCCEATDSTSTESGTLSTCSFTGVPLFLLTPWARVGMVVLNELAVFWTAENMEEKKVAAGLPGEAGPFSGVGVRGGAATVESLLGPALEPALRLWVIMFPVRTASAGRRGLLDAALFGRSSVGVGGVLTITGFGASPGGVRGGTSGSGFWARARVRLGTRDGLGSGSGFGAEATSGLTSAEEIFSDELFFDLNTSRSRLVDEDRFGRSSDGPRLVRLRASAGEDSRLSELSWKRVDEREGASGSGLWAACTSGDEVVK